MNLLIKISGLILAGVLIWQEFIPDLWDLGIWGLFCFLIIVFSEESRTFIEDKFSWLISHLF